MAYAEPPVRATGDLITAANWNQDIKDNVRWLAQDHWRAKLLMGNAQSVANNTVVTADWNTIVYDFGTLASTANDNFTIPNAFPTGITIGLFELKMNLSWASNSTGVRFIRFLKNPGAGQVILGADRRVATTFSEATLVVPDMALVANDIVRAEIFQDSGAALNTRVADFNPEFSIRWLAWQD